MAYLFIRVSGAVCGPGLVRRGLAAVLWAFAAKEDERRPGIPGPPAYGIAFMQFTFAKYTVTTCRQVSSGNSRVTASFSHAVSIRLAPLALL